MPNPFLNPPANGFASRPAQPPSQAQQKEAPPPNSSIFNPQIQKQFTGSSFRNPAFTTPQKRIEEMAFSEASAAEDSPALTDTSEMPADTPDFERTDDYARSTLTRASASRTLFAKPSSSVRSRTPGRGEIVRGNRDKVRKRKRLVGDRDVGSVRSRLPHDSADSDSDWEDRNPPKSSRQRRGGPGFVSRMFTAISDHPNLPGILIYWLQLGVNVFFVGVLFYAFWSAIAMFRGDLARSTEVARATLLQEMDACKRQYTANHCAPGQRLPALDGACDSWELCMNQDPDAVLRGQVSVKNMAELLNEFVGTLHMKAWVRFAPPPLYPCHPLTRPQAFIFLSMFVAILATNLGLGRLRESARIDHGKPTNVAPPHPAGPSMFPSSQDPHQAWLVAPIGQTPRHWKRDLLLDEATDTDASPSEAKSIMAPPRTPSRKGERGRSPTKYGRTPSRGY